MENVHVFAGGTDECFVGEFFFVLVEAASEVEFARRVFAGGAGDFLQVGFDVVGAKCLAVGVVDVGQGGVVSFAQVQPFLCGKVARVGGAIVGQDAVKRVVFPRQFVVGEVADAVGVVGVLRQFFGFCFDVRIKARIEDANDVVGVALPAHFALKVALGFERVAEFAHRFDVGAVAEAAVGGADFGDAAPTARAVEAERPQLVVGLVRPVGKASVFFLVGGAAAWGFAVV